MTKKAGSKKKEEKIAAEEEVAKKKVAEEAVEEEEEDVLEAEMRKAVLLTLVKSLGDSEEEDDEEDDEEEDDEEEEEEVEEKESKATSRKFAAFEKRLKKQDKEIRRLRKAQSPESMVIGRDLQLTAGDLAGLITTAVAAGIKAAPISSDKPPKEKGATDPSEFDEKHEPKGVVEQLSIEDMEDMTVEETTKAIQDGRISVATLEKALGKEKVAELRKAGLAHVLANEPIEKS